MKEEPSVIRTRLFNIVGVSGDTAPVLDPESAVIGLATDYNASLRDGHDDSVDSWEIAQKFVDHHQSSPLLVLDYLMRRGQFSKFPQHDFDSESETEILGGCIDDSDKSDFAVAWDYGTFLDFSADSVAESIKRHFRLLSARKQIEVIKALIEATGTPVREGSDVLCHNVAFYLMLALNHDEFREILERDEAPASSLAIVAAVSPLLSLLDACVPEERQKLERRSLVGSFVD